MPPDVEFLLNEAKDDAWVFRRDARITRPLSMTTLVIRFGVACLDPAIVLLFKAKARTAKDRADFDAVCARLGPERRGWLRSALETSHPGHPWIERL